MCVLIKLCTSALVCVLCAIIKHTHTRVWCAMCGAKQQNRVPLQAICRGSRGSYTPPRPPQSEPTSASPLSERYSQELVDEVGEDGAGAVVCTDEHPAVEDEQESDALRVGQPCQLPQQRCNNTQQQGQLCNNTQQQGQFCCNTQQQGQLLQQATAGSTAAASLRTKMVNFCSKATTTTATGSTPAATRNKIVNCSNNTQQQG